MKTWRDIEELADRAMLLRLIEEHGTPTRIARRLECSVESVKNAMHHHSLRSKRYKLGEDIRKQLRL